MLGSPFFGPALPGVLGYCAAGALLPLRLKLSRSRDVDRPISEQMPRLDLLPVLEGQVAVLSRQSHLRPMGL